MLYPETVTFRCTCRRISDVDMKPEQAIGYLSVDVAAGKFVAIKAQHLTCTRDTPNIVQLFSGSKGVSVGVLRPGTKPSLVRKVGSTGTDGCALLRLLNRYVHDTYRTHPEMARGSWLLALMRRYEGRMAQEPSARIRPATCIGSSVRRLKHNRLTGFSPRRAVAHTVPSPEWQERQRRRGLEGQKIAPRLPAGRQDKPSGPCLEASSRQWIVAASLTPRVWFSGVFGSGGFDTDQG
jgi:hypothetical protein